MVAEVELDDVVRKRKGLRRLSRKPSIGEVTVSDTSALRVKAQRAAKLREKGGNVS